MTQHGKTRIYIREVELKIDPGKTVKNKNVESSPEYMPVTWAENVVKFDIKFSDKN